MRRSAVVMLVALAAGCGDVATPATTEAGAGSSTAVTLVTTTTNAAPASSTTTSESPGASTGPEERAPDRSILEFGLEPGDTRPGRFRLVPGTNTDILEPVDGRYWVDDDGGVYTALDVDTSLIAEQMALLADAVAATGGQPADSSYVASLRDHYRGDEFQVGLTDLARLLALGGLPAEWAEQWGWFLEADGNPVPQELGRCVDAIASLDQAARRWVHDLEIELRDGSWTFPIERFVTDLAGEIDTAAICEVFVEPPGASPEIVIEVTQEADRHRIAVLVDDKIYIDREPELMFMIAMWPDESVGPPPDEPNPSSLMTLRGSYLVAIASCGELPWIYSNFAAADTYYAPESDGYGGPLVFASGWYCEDQVPEERRVDSG